MKMNAPKPSALENNSLHFFFFGGGVDKSAFHKSTSCMSILCDLSLMKENVRTVSYLETLYMQAFMLTFTENKMNHEYSKLFPHGPA